MNHELDNKDKALILILQEDIPITQQPFLEMAHRLDITERDLLEKIKALKEMEIIKRIDCRLNLKEMSFATTLVACKVPEADISRVKKILQDCKNITHNYLRKHEFNVWFTLIASSREKLLELLNSLQVILKLSDFLSFETKNTYKLKFQLNVK